MIEKTATALMLPTIQTRPNSYKVGVKTKSAKEMWTFNALRFGEQTDAIAYAGALHLRWSDVLDYMIADSDDTPNCTYPVPSDRYPVNR